MQLLIFVLAAFGLGYWFSRSRAADRLAEGTKNLTGRLQRNPGSKAENAPIQAEASTDQ